MAGCCGGCPGPAPVFLIGAVAISGLPPFNGFASEWLAFQALLYGFQASPEPLVHLLFPVAAALLALTGALAAACFVKAFGISFLALPRSAGRGSGPGSPRDACSGHRSFLAALCVLLGVFPGAVLTALNGVMASLPGLQPPAEMVRGPLGMAADRRDRSTAVTPVALALALVGGLGVAALAVVATRVGVPSAARRRGGVAGVLTVRARNTRRRRSRSR